MPNTILGCYGLEPSGPADLHEFLPLLALFALMPSSGDVSDNSILRLSSHMYLVAASTGNMRCILAAQRSETFTSRNGLLNRRTRGVEAGQIIYESSRGLPCRLFR